MSEPIRLQKLLAAAGIGSRRKIEELISAGRIRVNGKQAILGDRASKHDEVTVDGIAVELDADIETYLLHKPIGILSTADDELGRENVVDLINTNARLFPVGRLDKDTSGLIILTNDGDFAYILTHPKFGIEKKYVVQVQGEVTSEQVDQLRNGIDLEDGRTAPAKVRLLAGKKSESLLEITIHEGRNRQVRRMMSAIGHDVITLQRVQIGSISDHKLKPGQHRRLTAKEIYDLRAQASVEQ